MAWVLDLDGVIRLGDEPIPGAAEAVAMLRLAGEEVVFATNNAYRSIRDQEASLAAMGIPAAGAVVGAAQAGASLLHPGERVLVVGGPGLVEEVEARGCTLVEHGPCDAVISGLDRHFHYDALRRAGLAIRGGARWILTNPDPTFPTPDGLEPGAGAIGAAIRAAGGADPVIGGKPEGAMVGLLRDRLGDDGIVVGDRSDTDGLFAHALGYRFALVLSGVTTAADLPVRPAPWVVADDLLTLVRRTLGVSRRPRDPGVSSRVLTMEPGERSPAVRSAHPPGDMDVVFARAGDMAPLLCGFDWGSTALGDPTTWPQSLRSAASICLGAKYPIALYWGPELTLLYNDAWSLIPGDKHPWALGRPAREVWPDIWDIVGPEIERALAGEAMWVADRMLPMDRWGYVEETYFNYNFSPITAEDGRIEGVFNAGLETTPRVVASRHQRVLIDLIAETASATSVEEAFAGAITALADHREVSPFAVLYRLDDGVAHLAGSTGVSPGGEGTGPAVVLGVDDDPWRIHHAIETRRPVTIEDIGRFADVWAVDGWPELAHTAVTLPIVRSRRKRRRVEGVLVVGMPPGLRLDDQHEEFHAALADRLALSVLDARREEEDRRTFETEHRIAATLQRSLIPALPELEIVGLAGCYLPGTDGLEVGGDWYDAIPLPDGSVTVVIGDVVGKGVAAAAQMGQLRNALRAYVLEGFSPGEVLGKLNHLTLSLSGSTFATVLCLRYEPEDHTVRWCRAGHLPALVRRADGRVDLLDGAGSPPIGVFEGVLFRESEDRLEPDDVVVLYTDGLIEKPGEDIDVSIAALVQRVAALELGPSFLDAIVAPLAHGDRRDDVAVLVLTT